MRLAFSILFTVLVGLLASVQAQTSIVETEQLQSEPVAVEVKREPVKYKVKAGDSLQKIANRYKDISWGEIAVKNKLRSTLIHPEQQFTIPDKGEVSRSKAKAWEEKNTPKPVVTKAVATVQSSNPAPPTTPAPSGSCRDWLIQAGVPADQMDAAYALIMRESGCNPAVFNPSSGAGGIPQALPFSKMGCSTSDPICQIRWFINYCNQRYGSINQANQFQLANNWY